jgi:hypothetical protein
VGREPGRENDPRVDGNSVVFTRTQCISQGRRVGRAEHTHPNCFTTMIVRDKCESARCTDLSPNSRCLENKYLKMSLGRHCYSDHDGPTLEGGQSSVVFGHIQFGGSSKYGEWEQHWGRKNALLAPTPPVIWGKHMRRGKRHNACQRNGAELIPTSGDFDRLVTNRTHTHQVVEGCSSKDALVPNKRVCMQPGIYFTNRRSFKAMATTSFLLLS